MKTYLLNIWDTARASYWFVPGLFALGTILLTFIMPAIDVAVSDSDLELPEWVRTSPETARGTMSAMAGAVVAVTGTVFSITIVTLSLASQQFGPRLLRRFMHDLPTQVTLGVFLSTGLYCLLALRLVEHHEGGREIPHLSILLGVVLSVMSLAMLIAFIHHVAMLIQAPQVVANVAADLDDAIIRLFPEKLGEPASEDQRAADIDRQEIDRLGETCQTICSTQKGYIQAIDEEGLLELASQRELVLRLLSRPGDFISHGSPLVEAWSEKPTEEDEKREKELLAALNDKVIVGVRRTPRQDVECAVSELVEVAVRSLSPGINDPFTAINCIDYLGGALGRLAERELPAEHRSDKEGQLRIITRPIKLANVLDAAFNQIRQYGRDSVAVTIRLLESLTSIASHVERPEDAAAVKLHAEMVVRMSESFPEEHDRGEVRERFERLLATLKR